MQAQMPIRSFCLIAILVASTLLSLGQTSSSSSSPKKAEVGLEGSLGMSVGKDIVALNVGGPAFAIRFHKDWKVGVMALPSVVFRNNATVTRLGIAPRIQYKKLSLILPLYEFNTVWYMTAGLSYQFSK